LTGEAAGREAEEALKGANDAEAAKKAATAAKKGGKERKAVSPGPKHKELLLVAEGKQILRIIKRHYFYE